jgi:hypothetical protein
MNTLVGKVRLAEWKTLKDIETSEFGPIMNIRIRICQSENRRSKEPQHLILASLSLHRSRTYFWTSYTPEGIFLHIPALKSCDPIDYLRNILGMTVLLEDDYTICQPFCKN